MGYNLLVNDDGEVTDLPKSVNGWQPFFDFCFYIGGMVCICPTLTCTRYIGTIFGSL